MSFERRLSPAASEDNAATADAFTLRRIAVPAFGPSFLFGLGEGAILPVIALTVRQLGGSVALATVYSAALGREARDADAARRFIDALAGEANAALRAAGGFDAPVRTIDPRSGA